MNIQELNEDNNILNTNYYMSKNKDQENSSKVQNINKNNLNLNLNLNKNLNITRINIDSRYRNIESKNIISNKITYLTNNSLAALGLIVSSFYLIKFAIYSILFSYLFYTIMRSLIRDVFFESIVYFLMDPKGLDE
jgi:hypothetical protein